MGESMYTSKGRTLSLQDVRPEVLAQITNAQILTGIRLKGVGLDKNERWLHDLVAYCKRSVVQVLCRRGRHMCARLAESELEYAPSSAVLGRG